MDDAIPAAELPDSSPGAHDSSPSLRKLHFDGLRACNGADSAMKGGGGGELGGGAAGSNAAKYRLVPPARLPISRPPPCLMIPPGFSPSALLDSPVLLSHVKAEPSPTTGTLSGSMVVRDAVKSDTIAAYSLSCNEGSREFEVKPQCKLASASKLSPSDEMNNEDNAKVEGHPNSAVPGDQKKSAALVSVEKSSEDGYNWRKYGQKLVKGSDFPRSYYKCTHPNCEVKKQLERSHDGRITEILYKGKHDHPKPQPSRRSGVGDVTSRQKDEGSDVFRSAIKDTLVNGVSAVQDNDPCASPNLSPLNITGGVGVESVDTSTATSANVTNDEDDSELKRRKIDYSGADLASGGKMARDQRVVVQTVSEVDILDDGYRWRKYGQKVVKGNPNPRSYYKCTNAGCQVRKHVERASQDPKAVITTYEGKHNHDVPSSKTNDHNSSGTADNKYRSHIYARPLSVAVPDYRHSEENDIVSLDLGVGVTTNSTNPTSEAQLSFENQPLRNQMQITAPGDTW